MPNIDPLLRAIETVAADRNPATESNLYKQLLNSELLLAVDGGSPQRSDARAAASAPLVRLGNSAGEAAVLAFTDQEKLSRWRRENPFIEMQARRVFEGLLGLKVDLLILNIAGPIDALIPRKYFASLAQGAVPRAEPADANMIPAGTKLYYRQAAGPAAEALAGPLRFVLQNLKKVTDAYLMEQRTVPEQQGCLVLAVGFARGLGQGHKRELMDQLGGVPRSVLPPGESLSIFELSDGLRNTIAHRIQPLLR